MGFNSAVLILNDMLHEIEADPNIGKIIAAGIRSAGTGIGRDYHPHQIGFVPTQHADTTQIIAVGGNTIRCIGYAHWERGYPDEETILRHLADRMGYTLRKKAKS
jgi:hypothetical protein